MNILDTVQWHMHILQICMNMFFNPGYFYLVLFICIRYNTNEYYKKENGSLRWNSSLLMCAENGFELNIFLHANGWIRWKNSISFNTFLWDSRGFDFKFFVSFLPFRVLLENYISFRSSIFFGESHVDVNRKLPNFCFIKRIF